VNNENTDDIVVKHWTGRWIRGTCWCTVSYQMDSTRSCQLQSVYDQVRCVVIRHSHHRDCHLRPATLSRYV